MNAVALVDINQLQFGAAVALLKIVDERLNSSRVFRFRAIKNNHFH